MQNIKLVEIGDGATGKTCTLIAFTTGSFPGEYIPTVFDNYSANILFENVPYNVGLWDTAGKEDYDRLRPLSYPQTDVFLLAFSVINPHSLENCRTKWFPEVAHHAPGVPIVLYGTKMDLLSDTQALKNLQAKGMKPVTYEQACQVGKEIGASGVVFASSLTQQNLKFLFEVCIVAAAKRLQEQPAGSGGGGAVSKPKNGKWGDMFTMDPIDVFPSLVDMKYIAETKSDENGSHFWQQGRDMVFRSEATSSSSSSSSSSGSDKKVNRKTKLLEGMQVEFDWVVAEKVPMPYKEYGRYGICAFVGAAPGGGAGGGEVLCTVGGTDSHGRFVKDMLQFDLLWRHWKPPKKLFEYDEASPYGNFMSLVSSASANKAYVFGGKANGYLNSLWRCDLSSLKWTATPTTGEAPSPRYGHTAILPSSTNKMLVFGGYDNLQGCCNDMYELDLMTKHWSGLVVQGVVAARHSHCAFVYEHKHEKSSVPSSSMLVFGGTLADGKVSNELLCYNITQNSWVSLMCTGAVPPARCGSAGFVFRDQLFVFGGYDKVKDVVYGDLCVLSLETLVWRELVSNDAPSARYYHSAHCTPEGRLFLIGGRNASHTLCEDIEEFNVQSLSVLSPAAVTVTVKAGKQNRKGLSGVSRDVQGLVLSCFSAVELIRCAVVCRTWNELSKSEILWQQLCISGGVIRHFANLGEPIKSFRLAYLAAMPLARKMKEEAISRKYRDRLCMGMVGFKKSSDKNCVLQ